MLVIELVVAAAVLSHPPRDRSADPSPSAGSGTAVLVVGHGRTVRLLSLGGQGTDHLLLDRVAAGIGTAVDDVEAFWGLDFSDDILVIATGSDQQFRSQAGGGTARQWADIAAVAVADRVDPARRSAVGQRIVFAPGAAAMSAPALRIVLTHELFHYAARADTALDAPRWLAEGVADFVARPDTAPPHATVLATRLPSDADLDAPGPRRSLAYDRAWWFTRFVADRYGAAKLRELYLAACGVGRSAPATAVRRVLGIDVVGLLARWRQWTASEA